MTGHTKGVLLDIGGVLLPDHWTATARTWGDRLGVSPDAFMSALFGGNDDAVLIGRVAERD